VAVGGGSALVMVVGGCLMKIRSWKISKNSYLWLILKLFFSLFFIKKKTT
jgi:hypothetical protein